MRQFVVTAEAGFGGFISDGLHGGGHIHSLTHHRHRPGERLEGVGLNGDVRRFRGGDTVKNGSGIVFTPRFAGFDVGGLRNLGRDGITEVKRRGVGVVRDEIRHTSTDKAVVVKDAVEGWHLTAP